MHFFTQAVSVLALIGHVATSPIDAATAELVTLDALNLTQAVAENDMGSTCVWKRNIDMFPFIRRHYEVTIPDVPETHTIEETCSLLWKQLKKWAACTVSSPHGCGKLPNTKRALRWHFSVIDFCNGGIIESTFWEATGHGDMGDVKPCKKI